MKKEKKSVYEHPLCGESLPEECIVINEYTLKENFIYAKIIEHNKIRFYYLIEPILTNNELAVYHDVITALEYEINVPREYVNPIEYFDALLNKVIKIYGIRNKGIDLEKIKYYVRRDMVGLGPLEPLLLDPNIEDISINGLNKYVYVWHRVYENIPTNLIFRDEKTLDNNITRLVHISNRHISSANPIADAALPGGHRLNAMFRREVSPDGSSITIRKFKEIPISIIELIRYGTINYLIAAYLWLLMENRITSVVIGSTGSGKTTTLNALLSLLPANMKIVTIEEVKEINIDHENWLPLLVRFSYIDKSASVSAFKLVKAAMRMRPDLLVIGEVRGEEAYALFQALSTGHGGMFTMHAEDANSAIQRLISKPMNVAPAYIQFLDLALVVRRVTVNNKTVRRLINVDEIIDANTRSRMFEWNARDDRFVIKKLQKSVKLQKIMQIQSYDADKLMNEFTNRIKVLYWLNSNNINSFREVSQVLQRYRITPQELITMIDNDFKSKNIDIDNIIKKMFDDSQDNSLDLKVPGFK